MARVEPVWNAIEDALVEALENIRASTDSNYWYDLKRVFTEAYGVDEVGISKALLPAIILENVPPQTPRNKAGGSQTISGILVYNLIGIMKNDPSDKTRPRKEMNRLVQDIHRALTADRKLGLSRVSRLTFPTEPILDTGALTGESDRMVFKYVVQIAYSFDESLP